MSDLIDVPKITYREALNQALHEEMDRDPDVFIMGEDIGEFGGVYAVTRGLHARFGADRVLDTPISEGAFMGVAVGAAMTGKRPIVEIMYMDFLPVCADQIINQAAKMRSMSGGQLTVPMVIRTQTGGWRGSGAQHTQSLESLFAHIPGLKVVMPSTPSDAKGLLKTAIRDDNPVLFMEHRMLYGTKGEVPDDVEPIPFGQAIVRREGTHVTVLATSMSVHNSLKAAEELAAEGIELEVIDLRTIVPLDLQTVLESVRKTHRAVVVHQAHKSFGPGAEIASRLHEAAFDVLEAPVVRVAAEDIAIPANPTLEQHVLPSPPAIVAACRALAGQTRG
jgi:pyruvate/2-oxoglutarate/acetoin dehydrogenase E1 component